MLEVHVPYSIKVSWIEKLTVGFLPGDTLHKS